MKKTQWGLLRKNQENSSDPIFLFEECECVHEDEKQILFSFFSKKKLFADESQCGNYMIFLSLRFYVKSILRILEAQKLPFLQILGFWFLLIWSISPFKKCKIHKHQNSEYLNLTKWQIFRLWFHAKSECQNNSVISTHCGSITFCIFEFFPQVGVKHSFKVKRPI